MSVINQMLKDLEQRGSDQTGSDKLMRVLNIRPGQSSFDKQVFKSQVFLALGFAVLALALLLVWRNIPVVTIMPTVTENSSIKSLDVTSMPMITDAKEIAFENSGALLSAREKAGLIPVQNIRMYQHQDRFRIVLDLPESVSHRVERIFTGDAQVQYKFRGVYLDSEQPPLTAENDFLKSVRIHTQRNVLLLELDMQNNMISSYSELPLKQSLAYRMVIDIQPLSQKVKGPIGTAKQLPSKPDAAEKLVVESENNMRIKKSEIKSELPVKQTDAGEFEIKRIVSPELQAKAAYRNALNLLQANRVAPAINELRKAVTLMPGFSEARETLSVLLLKTGQTAEVGIVMAQGHRLDPGNADFTKLYGRFLADNGEYAKAQQVLISAWSQASEDADYLALLAVIAQQLGHHQKAADTYIKALGLNAKQGSWWVGMAISLEALGKKEEARRAYLAAREHGMLDQKLLRYAELRIRKLGS